jgi:hypothetical protein
MCGPAAVVLPIAAAAVSIGGQLFSGAAAHNQANYEAGIARQNAGLSEEQAHDSILNTQLEAQRRYREGGRLEGQQQAAMGANNIDLNYGSALDVQRDTKMITGEDVGQIYKAGYQRTRGYEMEAYNSRSQASAARAKGTAALISAGFGAASTALGAASQMSKGRK